MKKISRSDAYLRNIEANRHEVCRRREISFLHRGSQTFNRVLLRSDCWSTALDKIPALFHLHKPQDRADLQLGYVRSIRADCATAAHARLKISIGITFVANQG